MINKTKENNRYLFLIGFFIVVLFNLNNIYADEFLLISSPIEKNSNVSMTSPMQLNRVDPVSGSYSSAHSGVDYGAPSGTKQFAIADGVVTSAEYSGGYGYAVVIKHKFGYTTRHAHLLPNLPVKKGDKVKKGQVIGLTGSTGNSTGAHMHFELMKSNKPVPFYRGSPKDYILNNKIVARLVNGEELKLPKEGTAAEIGYLYGETLDFATGKKRSGGEFKLGDLSSVDFASLEGLDNIGDTNSGDSSSSSSSSSRPKWDGETIPGIEIGYVEVETLDSVKAKLEYEFTSEEKEAIGVWSENIEITKEQRDKEKGNVLQNIFLILITLHALALLFYAIVLSYLFPSSVFVTLLTFNAYDTIIISKDEVGTLDGRSIKRNRLIIYALVELLFITVLIPIIIPKLYIFIQSFFRR